VGGEILMSPNPQVAFTYAFDANTSLVTFDNTSTIAGGSITGYAWDFGDTNSSTETDPTHTYASGVYTVVLTATSNQGCVSTFETQVNATVGVSELQASWIAVYPNPTADLISVYSPVAGEFCITDLTGKKVVENMTIGASQLVRISTESWAVGAYQVTIFTASGTMTTRVLKVN
jgi:PKD repeat protein